MKTDIDTLKNSLLAGFEAFENSRKLAEEVWEAYHNRQYTSQQEAILENRGQPKETFNVIKLFTRMIVGYYSMVLNDIKVMPRNPRDITVATLLNDVINYILEQNHWETEADAVKIDGLLSGLMVTYVNVQPTGKADLLNRDEYNIGLTHIPFKEIILDPMSRKVDYSDARFLHRFKWISQDVFDKIFGKEKRKEVDANSDFLNIDYSSETYMFDESNYSTWNGSFRVQDNYLVVHTIIQNNKGEWEEIFWCGDTILFKQNLTKNKIPLPYIVVKMNDSTKAEFYGIFKEVLETQKAINQAIIRIQLLVNTNKAFVEEGAVENLEEFKAAFERVNSVIPVLNLQGIRVDNMSQDIANQYNIINSALDRIQRVLGINDSFLGMAYASDSGRKVKLQQNATIVALRYITKRFELYYRLLGRTLLEFIQKYYSSHRILRITDQKTGERWVEVNRPLMDYNGQPLLAVDYDENGEPKKDEQGNIIVYPLHEADTDIRFADVDVIINVNSYNDEDERNQLLLETFINGAIGQALATVNPQGFFQIGSMIVKNMKSKYSYDIAAILEQTAAMLAPQPQMQETLGYAKQAGYKESGQPGGNPGQGSSLDVNNAHQFDNERVK